MSGFLGRLAARSTGEAETARPRLPAALEVPALGGPGPEVVDEETVLPAPQAAPAAPRPAASVVGAQRDQAVRTSAAPRSPWSAPTAATPVAIPQRTEPLPATPAADEPAPAVAPPPGPARIAAQGAVERRAEPAAVVPAAPATAAPVRAIPASRTTTAPPRDGAGEPAVQPPVIRVHIGRLEVRANLRAALPAPIAAPREEARADGLALSAYLRGERDVG